MAPNSLNHDTLSHLLESLVIPVGFKEYGNALADEKAVLDDWSRRSISSLKQLGGLLDEVDANDKGCSLQDLAQIVAAVSPFAYDPRFVNELEGHPPYEEENNVLQGESPWIAPGGKSQAQDVLSKVRVKSTAALVTHILQNIVRPIFRASNPHPHVNPTTGRSLPPSRIAKPPQQGGLSSLTQDFFDSEGQRWKDNVGLGAAIYWCLDNISPDAYHDAWHLVVPPLMTLLDDYQTQYKLWGLLLTSRMLQSAPPGLLQKTGIDGLLKTSFRKILAHQDSPLSPTILRLSLSHSVRLVTLTTPEGSKARFDALSDLLGQGIINDIWTYTFDKPDIIRATLDSLPPLVRTLGVGSTRFLQGLMPQLVHPLVNHPTNYAQHPLDLLQLQMQIASLRVLIFLIQVCAPRMQGWRFTILDALVRCWVAMIADRSEVPSILSSPWTLSTQDADSDDEEVREIAQSPGHVKVELPIDVQTIRPLDTSSITENSTTLATLLQVAAYALAQACPSLTKVEYPLLSQREPIALKGLLPQVQSLEQEA